MFVTSTSNVLIGMSWQFCPASGFGMRNKVLEIGDQSIERVFEAVANIDASERTQRLVILKPLGKVAIASMLEIPMIW